ncbi:MAG: MazG nucleotide pyrophosphohydrolase domain-containing protein [bacterium]
MRPENSGFAKLVGIMKRLLAPGGCPWDRRQTHDTLLRYLREETREVSAAVKKKNWRNLEEELGDILLQVVFHAELARRQGRFGINDVLRCINSKLIRRHPHVFGKKKLSSAGEVAAQWNRIKAREKAGYKTEKSEIRSQ